MSEKNLFALEIYHFFLKCVNIFIWKLQIFPNNHALYTFLQQEQLRLMTTDIKKSFAYCKIVKSVKISKKIANDKVQKKFGRKFPPQSCIFGFVLTCDPNGFIMVRIHWQNFNMNYIHSNITLYVDNQARDFVAELITNHIVIIGIFASFHHISKLCYYLQSAKLLQVTLYSIFVSLNRKWMNLVWNVTWAFKNHNAISDFRKQNSAPEKQNKK